VCSGMRDRIVTPFIPPRTSLESLARSKRFKQKIEDLPIGREDVEKFLQNSLVVTPICWKDPKYERIGFLAYLGKLNSPLRSEKPLPDMSNLSFLINISDFLSGVSKELNKDLKFVIFYENRYFDLEIFGLDRWNEDKVKLTQFLIEEFKIKNIELIDLYDFLEKYCLDYFPEFEKQLKNVKFDLNDPQVRETFYISYYSYPFETLEEAISAYTSEEGKEKIKEWAIDVTKKYLAFLEARRKIGFWEKVEECGIERATISWKRNVISIDPRVGKLSFSHGVALISNQGISTEWFIDLLGSPLQRLVWKDLIMGYMEKQEWCKERRRKYL